MPKGTAILRERNKRRLLSFIRQLKETSRQDLVQHMNVSKNTISLIVEEFIKEGVLKEVGIKEPGRKGRPKVIIKINKEGYKSIGFFINKKHIEYTVTNYYGDILENKRIHFLNDNPDETKKKMFAEIKKLLNKHDHVLGVGIGIPGIINVKEKTLYSSTHLGWKNVSFKKECDDLGVNVNIENSVNMGALCATEVEGFKKGGSSFFVHVGEGVGGAYIVENMILNGATWTVGEIGHISIEPNGNLCGCGQRGCLEQLISIGALHKRLAKLRGSDDIGNLNPSQMSDDDLLQTQAYKNIMKEFGTYLGRALVQVIHLMNPNKIFIDTPYNNYKEFSESCTNYMKQSALEIPYRKTNIVFGKKGYSMSKGAALSVIINYERFII